MNILFFLNETVVFRHQLQHHDEDIKQCWRFKPLAMYSARSIPRCASRRQRLRRNRFPTPLHLRMGLSYERTTNLKDSSESSSSIWQLRGQRCRLRGQWRYSPQLLGAPNTLGPLWFQSSHFRQENAAQKDWKKGAPEIPTSTRLSSSTAKAQTFSQEP